MDVKEWGEKKLYTMVFYAKEIQHHRNMFNKVKSVVHKNIQYFKFLAILYSEIMP